MVKETTLSLFQSTPNVTVLLYTDRMGQMGGNNGVILYIVVAHRSICHGPSPHCAKWCMNTGHNDCPCLKDLVVYVEGLVYTGMLRKVHLN